jgi:4a-hydroxytetrahydrobiopterin dehydratase
MDQSPPTGWTLRDRALVRTIQRKDFVDALACLLAIGRLAEAADHHPDVDLRYNQLHLSLSTHSAGHQVTEKDFALAQQINELHDDDIRFIRQDLRSRLTP